jgi:hypothetical protein
MPPEHSPRNETGGPPKHRRLRKILLFATVAIALGYLVGSLNDPFLLILYGQLAFFTAAVVLVLRIKPNRIALGLVLLIIAAQALRQREISVVLGFLLLGQLAVLGWKRGPGWRKAVWISGAMSAAAIILGLIFLPHKPAQARPAADPAAAAAAFESLPYLSHVDHKADKKDGVLAYDPAAASPGLNLYNSYYKAGAYLLDMAGDVIHTWLPPGAPDHWQFVAVCANGDLLVCVEDAELMRLDWASRVLWRKPMRIHHEIVVADNQDIYTLTSREEVVRIDSLPVPLIDDYVVILSPEGVVKREISLFHVLERQLSALNVAAIYLQVINPPDLFWRVIKAKLARGLLLPRVTSFDPFHTNSISILDRDVLGLGRRGNVLVSMRSLDLIGIVDIETETLTWAWGPGDLQEQHHPTLLDNGNLLVFDNGTKRKYSRVLELDPRSKAVVWEYRDTNAAAFYSNWGGTAQRLANGNTLITETSGGRVFEITRDGRVVWDFYNPDKQADGRRASIYRLTRITDPTLGAALLKKAATER